jgi:hypothetical protein
MATWYSLECDHADRWSLFSDTDTEPTGPDLLCPAAGHPAVTLSRSPLDELVRITIAASSRPPASQSETRSKFFLELSTWDARHHLRSRELYGWDEAVKKADAFHNLSWQDAERRWTRLKM